MKGYFICLLFSCRFQEDECKQPRTHDEHGQLEVMMKAGNLELVMNIMPSHASVLKGGWSQVPGPRDENIAN